jgi:hypothetical protein
MRQVLTILGAATIVVFAVGAAHAQSTYWDNAPDGMAYFNFSNQDNGILYFNGYGGSPNYDIYSAASGGAIWIKTGAAAPALLSEDVNMQLNWRPNSTSPWTMITTLLTTPPTGYTQGSAYGSNWGDSFWGDLFPGTFGDLSGSGNTVGDPDPISNYVVSAGEYCLPGSANLDFSQFQFELYAWTGSYSDYPSALAASAGGTPGIYAADSGPFLANPGTDPSSGGSLGLAMKDNVMPLGEGAFYNMSALVLQRAFPGDANGDGRVDINDLTIVLANYGQTGCAWSQGCMDGDPTGAVDINDLTIVLANYGRTAGAVGIGAVPEPGTLLLLAAGLAGLLARAWRRAGEPARPPRAAC